MRRIPALALTASMFTLALPLLLGGCNSSLGSDGDGEDEVGDGDSDGDGDGEGDDGFGPICSDADPCPDGQFCFNGVCALGCTSDGDCADNQYCDTEQDMLCKNKEVPTCSEDEDCAASQICFNEICSTPPEDTSCEPGNISDDGCDSMSVCFEELDSEDTSCYTMPPCGEDGSCPAGTTGAVCNDGYLPNKDAICLLGLCESASDCPPDWSCEKFGPNDPLGFCDSGSGGGPGEPCSADDECLSGTCTIPVPGTPGFCQ